MLKYCLGFIIYRDKMILLNRQKEPWTGRWNGVGGKLESGENGYQAMQREAFEETGIKIRKIIPKGILTWDHFSVPDNGMYIYFLEADSMDETVFPKKTDEGILDLKEIDWIINKNNTGICDNIPLILECAYQNKFFHIHNIWNHYQLIKSEVFELDQKYIKELA